MYAKKAPEVIEEVQTPVWTCENETCNGWMRVNFVFQDEPNCPLCGNTMLKESRMLPVLVNSTKTNSYT
nr:cold-shock protein [Gorillibacterium massiliense]